jgi:hypothetical protein
VAEFAFKMLADGAFHEFGPARLVVQPMTGHRWISVSSRFLLRDSSRAARSSLQLKHDLKKSIVALKRRATN